MALASQSQIWGRVRSPLVLFQTTTHIFFYSIQNETVGVEQSFAVFLHGKAASRPFKMTSEMEFFYAFNFSRGGQCQKVKGSGFI